MNHELKIWPTYFATLGLRSCEIRANDRNFTEGDTLTLKEWDPATEEYTGREAKRRIGYVFAGPLVDANEVVLPKGYALLSLAPLYAPMTYPGEPIFVLRGQDKLAAPLVREWAHDAQRAQCPEAKVAEAREIAQRMEEWPDQKYPD